MTKSVRGGSEFWRGVLGKRREARDTGAQAGTNLAVSSDITISTCILLGNAHGM